MLSKSDGRAFVTFIGSRGTPASLASVSAAVGAGSGPLLKPYPDWSWHAAGECRADGLAAVRGLEVTKINSGRIVKRPMDPKAPNDHFYGAAPNFR